VWLDARNGPTYEVLPGHTQAIKKMPRALIIGGTGFVGAHLQQSLLPKFEITATGQESDVRDSLQIRRLVTKIVPDVVINLASITTVAESFADPMNTYRIGFWGTLNILVALKEIGFTGRVLNVSSSEVYGHPAESDLPLTERGPLRPMSPYAVSKVAAEQLCFQWGQTEPFEIVTARPFTHIGPGQSDRFAISSMSKQIAEIMLGRARPVVRVGNLDTTRDLTDVRDVARAYTLLLEKGANGETYNVCSAREQAIRAVLKQLIDYTKLEIKVEEDPSLVRSAEQTRICGNYDKLKKDTGWEPTTPLRSTLEDTISYWLRKLK
jgi:GDP-4-dehydro-6-deoxy-D-mannose reductase